MTTFLRRYISGEQMDVWGELRASGEHVYDKELYNDALAVARETMRRARRNIEIIIQRLTEMGYIFGYAQRRVEIAPDIDAMRDPCPDNAPSIVRASYSLHHLTAPFVPAEAEDLHLLQELQEQYGSFPMSLAAWYEIVGAVNLVGSMPAADPLEFDGFNDLYQYRAACANGHMDRYHYPAHDLDPLWVYPLSAQVQRLQLPSTHASQRRSIVIARAEVAKQGFSAPGVYEIVLPNRTIDARLVGERSGATFVGYLRRCFQWGGFPGLELRAHPPIRELNALTYDLLPI